MSQRRNDSRSAGKSTFLRAVRIACGGGFDDELLSFATVLRANFASLVERLFVAPVSLALPSEAREFHSRLVKVQGFREEGVQLIITEYEEVVQLIITEYLKVRPALLEELYATPDDNFGTRHVETFATAEQCWRALRGSTPTMHDVLRVREATRSLVELKCAWHNCQLHVIEMGRYERRRWPCFEGLECVIYFVDLTDQHKHLPYDTPVLSIEEARAYFVEIAGGETYGKAKVIVIGTHFDALEAMFRVARCREAIAERTGAPDAAMRGPRSYARWLMEAIVQTEHPDRPPNSIVVFPAVCQFEPAHVWLDDVLAVVTRWDAPEACLRWKPEHARSANSVVWMVRPKPRTDAMVGLLLVRRHHALLSRVPMGVVRIIFAHLPTRYEQVE